jgi:hypothetical protein
MKNIIKILILLCALALAVGGIMIYAKTKVAPPTLPKAGNQYSSDIAQCCETFYHATNESSADSAFDVTTDRIQFFKHEGKLQPSEADECINQVVEIYGSKFAARCFARFDRSVWNNSEFSGMLARISRLQSIKLYESRSRALAESTSDSLNKVKKIISTYRSALAVSGCTSFSGIEEAKSVIARAHEYASDRYLSKCTSLIGALNSLKAKIGQSHYEYIVNQVEKLKGYSSYSKDYYMDTLVPLVNDVVTEYDNNAESIYGSKRDVQQLWTTARTYYDEAFNYYPN